jgi:hypothetical protein
LALRRSRITRWTLAVATLAFLIVICSQRLIWARWILPCLPAFSIFAAVAIVEIARRLGERWGRRMGIVAGSLLFGAVAIPCLVTARADALERQTDTRSLASRWAERHIAAGSTVAIEHLAFDLLRQPWTILYPLGEAGCVSVTATLKSQIDYPTVQRERNGSALIDLGTVSTHKLASCRADYTIVSNYDRYLAEAGRHPGELATYRRLLAGTRIVATFRPVRGRIGGPIVRVLARKRAP